MGLPCQIHGLNMYLKDSKNLDYLYTVDLLCLGTPPVPIFHKYLEENYKIKNLKNITFRDKRDGRGWICETHTVELKNDSILIYIVVPRNFYRGLSRITNILSVLGLEDRLIYENQDITNMDFDFNIDYSEVNKKLDKLKEKSLSWLKTALENGQNHTNNTFSLYDLYLKQEYNMLKEIEKNKRFRAKSYIESIFKDTNNHDVIAWGVGFSFYKNFDKISNYIDIKYCCDNDKEIWGNNITENIKIISPETLKRLNDPLVIIFVENRKVCNKIAKQLESLNVSKHLYIYDLLKEVF